MLEPSILDIIKKLTERVEALDRVGSSFTYDDNMVLDHSFERLTRTGGVLDAYQLFAITAGSPVGVWYKTGTPQMRSSKATGIWSYSPFNLQSAVVNNANYLSQHVRPTISGGAGPYCFSAYVAAAANKGDAGQVAAMISIQPKDSGGNNVGSPAINTLVLTPSYSAADNFQFKRISVVIPTTIASTDTLKLSVYSAEGNWVDTDGWQLTAGNRPQPYSPENNLWAHLDGLI